MLQSVTLLSSAIPSLFFLLPLFCSSEEDFEKLPASTVPEMQRTNLASVILQLKALGIDNVLRFSFLSVSSSLCLFYILISKNGAWPLGKNVQKPSCTHCVFVLLKI